MRKLSMAFLIATTGVGVHAQRAAYVRGFPVAGTYDVVQVVNGKQAQFSKRLDASNPQDFQRTFIGSTNGRCRDRQVKIGNGAFGFSEICDAPDGDIHNIRTVVTGNFSSQAVDLAMETALWGRTIRTTQNYRLRSR